MEHQMDVHKARRRAGWQAPQFLFLEREGTERKVFLFVPVVPETSVDIAFFDGSCNCDSIEKIGTLVPSLRR